MLLKMTGLEFFLLQYSSKVLAPCNLKKKKYLPLEILYSIIVEDLELWPLITFSVGKSLFLLKSEVIMF